MVTPRTNDCRLLVIYRYCAKMLIKARLSNSQKPSERGSPATTTDHQENTTHTFSTSGHGAEEGASTRPSERPTAKLKHAVNTQTVVGILYYSLYLKDISFTAISLWSL